MPRLLATLLSSLPLLSSASLWTLLAPENAAAGPAPRLGAASLGSPTGTSLLVTGGCSSSCCYAPLTDAWLFSGGAWSNVSQVGAPSGRLYHGASPAGGANDYYVFGGTDVTTGMLAELYLVAVDPAASPPTAAWQLVGGGGGGGPVPPARASHSQSALPGGGGSFLVYGGEDDDATSLGDAWLFSPQGGGGGSWARVAPAAGAPAPANRTQHAALALALGAAGARAVVVSGGMDSDGSDSDEVWALAVDAAPPQWLLLGTRGGGGGAWPAARHGHALWGSAAPGQPGDVALTLFIYGGQNSSVPDPANFLGDAWRFDVALRVGAGGALALAGGAQGRFSLLDAGGAAGEPGPRALGAFASAGTQLLYAGGFAGYNGGTDDRLFNDVWAAAAGGE
jgi:hypothetical protein